MLRLLKFIILSLSWEVAFGEYDWVGCTYYGIPRVSWRVCTNFQIPTAIGKNPFGTAICMGYMRCKSEIGGDGVSQVIHVGNTCQTVEGIDGSKIAAYKQGETVTVAYPSGYDSSDNCPGVPMDGDEPLYPIIIRRTERYDFGGRYIVSYMPNVNSYHCASYCPDTGRSMCVFSFTLESNLAVGQYELNWQYSTATTTYSNCWRMEIKPEDPILCLYSDVNYGGTEVCITQPEDGVIEFLAAPTLALAGTVKSFRLNMQDVYTISLYDGENRLNEYYTDTDTGSNPGQLTPTITNSLSKIYVVRIPDLDTVCVYKRFYYEGERKCYKRGDSEDFCAGSCNSWNNAIKSIRFGPPRTKPPIRLWAYDNSFSAPLRGYMRNYDYDIYYLHTASSIIVD